jgi:hypothetical protein
MPAKKRLIARMAAAAATVLAVAVAVGVVALLVERQHRRRFADQRESAERQRVEESRAYLAEVAKRIDRLPVDATLASEVESRYFEERPRGAQYVWATDLGGGFSFGVPRSAFDKLNAIYDREVTPRLREGLFVDRQSFLLAFIDDYGNMHAGPDGRVDLVERGHRLPLDRWEPNGTIVLSVPLKTETGGPLGSLYLKRAPAPERHREEEPAEFVAAVGGATAVFSLVFLWILLPTWVYVDARERGVRRAPLFAFLTVLSGPVGLIVYLIARPEERPTLTCPGCAREVADGAFCPHCGRDLSRAICPTCRYPLQAEWAYCPSCRTEVRAQPTASPVPEAG